MNRNDKKLFLRPRCNHGQKHCDSFKEPYNRPDQSVHGKVRKLCRYIC